MFRAEHSSDMRSAGSIPAATQRPRRLRCSMLPPPYLSYQSVSDARNIHHIRKTTLKALLMTISITAALQSAIAESDGADRQ